jgi:hypothetical protein
MKYTMLILSTFMLASVRVLACPSCSDNFTKSGPNAGIGESYSWSVLFLLGVPITIVGLFTFMLVRRLRNPQ